MNYEFARGSKIRNQSAPHFLTFNIIGWIDLFSRQCYRDIILRTFEFLRKQHNLSVIGYAIMSNQVLVIWKAGKNNLTEVIIEFKTITSRSLINAIQQENEGRKDWLLHLFNVYSKDKKVNGDYNLWTINSHPEEIYSEAFLKQKLEFFHQSPVKAGIVSKSEDYIYSSAANYVKGRGLMEVDLLKIKQVLY